MKSLLKFNKVPLVALVLLLYSVHSNAQAVIGRECAKCINAGYDERTGDAMKKSVPIKLVNQDSNKGMIINWRYYTETGKATLAINPINAGYCIDNNAPIFFFFEDGSKLTLKNQFNFNCDDKIEVSFTGMLKEIDEFKALSAKKLSLIRVVTSTSYVEHNLNASQAEEFKTIAKCISQPDSRATK